MVAGDEFEAILSYKGNVRPAWAIGDLVSKEVLEKKIKQSHPKSHHLQAVLLTLIYYLHVCVDMHLCVHT